MEQIGDTGPLGIYRPQKARVGIALISPYFKGTITCFSKNQAELSATRSLAVREIRETPCLRFGTAKNYNFQNNL